MGNVAIGGTRVTYKKGTGTLVAGRFVKLASAITIVPLAADTDIPCGVLVEKTARTDYPVAVQIDGIIDVEAGSAGVTYGSTVKIDAAGCVVDASTVAAGEVIVGQALETATDGNYAKVKISLAAFNLA